MSYSRIKLNHTLFVAIALHGFAILAFGFTSWQKTNSTNTLEVTLAEHQSDTPNPDADFFAQMDQQGSGSSQIAKKLSDTRQLLPLADNNNAPTNAEQNTQQNQPSLEPEQSNSKQAFKKNISSFDIVTTINSSFTIDKKQPTKPQPSVSNEVHNNSLQSQIVALKSQIDLRRQEIAKAPKKRVISTMSTKSHQDAAYLENWRRRIVTVGNIHYPKAADQQKIYGRVRLLIAMRADGNVKSIEILESSGKKILDQGAVKIIRLAAPFEAFSQQMRKNTDVLEIIRTIEFEKTTHIY